MKNRIKYLYIFLVINIINFTLLGCFNTKVSECKKIINISEKLAEVTQINSQTEDINNILKTADNFDDSAQQILNKKIKDQSLAKKSQKLAIIYQKYAQLTRNFIIAFQQKDTENAITYKQEIIKLYQEQENIVNNINSYCQQN